MKRVWPKNQNVQGFKNKRFSRTILFENVKKGVVNSYTRYTYSNV